MFVVRFPFAMIGSLRCVAEPSLPLDITRISRVVSYTAPHTAASLINDKWEHSYSRTKAAYPTDSLYKNKYWVPVGRVNNAHGDRNLVCSCLPIEAYQEQATI